MADDGPRPGPRPPGDTPGDRGDRRGNFATVDFHEVLGDTQRERWAALHAARQVLMAKPGPMAGAPAPDAMDLYHLATYITTGDDPWPSTPHRTFDPEQMLAFYNAGKADAQRMTWRERRRERRQVRRDAAIRRRAASGRDIRAGDGTAPPPPPAPPPPKGGLNPNGLPTPRRPDPFMADSGRHRAAEDLADADQPEAASGSVTAVAEAVGVLPPDDTQTADSGQRASAIMACQDMGPHPSHIWTRNAYTTSPEKMHCPGVQRNI